MANPFEIVYDALWDSLEENQRLMDLVKKSNRIKYERITDPKTDHELADLPEIVVEPQSTVGAINFNSSSTQFVKQYVILITTGDLRLDKKFHTVSWEIMRSLVSWWHTVTTAQWNSKSFVKRVTLATMNEGLDVNTEVADLLGWKAAAAVDVEMHFLTSELILDQFQS